MRIRRLKTLVLFSVLMGVLLGAGVVLRNVVLHQVRKRIEATLHYGKIRLRPIPPSIILEDVRTVTSSPFFAAEKVVLQISTRSLFRRDRPLRVFIDRPTVRLYAKPSQGPRRPLSLDLRLPFAVEQGFIRNGEAYYWGGGLSVLARGVRAVFRQTSDAFLLQAECDEHDILMEGLTGQVTGKTRLVLEGRGERLTLRRLTVQGPDYLLKASGVFTKPKDPEFEVRATVRGPVLFLADALDLPFRWTGTVEGAGRVTREAGAVKIQASLESDDLVLNDIPMGRVAAGVALGGGQLGRVDIQARKATGPAEYVDLTFAEGKIQGEARGVHLDPVIREVNIPWPVRSPAWGRFVLDRKTLRVEGEFRDDLLLEEPDRFPFRGPIALEWDGGRRVTFSSDRVESSFGGMAVNGDLVVGGNIGVFIRGEVTDVRRARQFVSRALGMPLPIPDIRGSGTATVGILGPFAAPEVKVDFSLAPGGFDRFDAAAATGTVEVAPSGTTGFVRVNDPAFKSDIRLNLSRGLTEVDFSDAEGSVEWILPPLGVDLPLKGRASGRFGLRDAGRGLEVGGDFAAAALELAGQRFEDLGGRLGFAAADNTLTLSNLVAGYNRGRVEGGLVLGLTSREFSCDLKAREVDLSALVPKIQGLAGGTLKGKGHLDRDAAEGSFEIRGLRYASIPPSDAAGTLRLALPGGRLEARAQGVLEPGRNDFELNVRYPESERSWFLSASGTLSNPDRLIPWPGAKAGLRYLAEVRGGTGPAQLNGAVELSGTIFPIPGFAHALTDFSGLVTLQNDRATIRSFQGRIGGGDVFGAGEIQFGRGGLEAVDIRADGRDMVLSLFERTRGRADGSFRLAKNAAGFFLSGDVDVRQLLWRREVTDRFEFAASPYPESRRGPGFLDDLALDIRLRGEDNVVIENSLGRIEGRFDLTIAGTVASPVILGDIEGVRGSVRFQDRSFRVLRARLSFFNPVASEPYLDFRGETFLKDYRVTFSLAGVPSKLQPEFASSPPLPPEDVLALLALGESFKRTYSYDASAGVGTGALISGQLTDEAKKQAEKLFRLDRFRIDPFVLGSSTDMTARLTVGKKISSDIIVLYSTNLTSQREEIVRLEWEFSESFSLVAMRDDRGRLSLDAKVRRRF